MKTDQKTTKNFDCEYILKPNYKKQNNEFDL